MLFVVYLILNEDNSELGVPLELVFIMGIRLFFFVLCITTKVNRKRKFADIVSISALCQTSSLPY